MVDIYIGLGSNLNNPADQIRNARITLAQQDNIIEIKFSSLYASPPMGPQDQPDYVNAVMSIISDLSALELLRKLQHIENSFGRIRKDERWGARILDLDLLLYSDQRIDLPNLVVPHSGLSERAFVLYPLNEIAPKDLLIPGMGTINQLISHCPLNGLKKLA